MENFNDPSEDLASMWCETRRPANLHPPPTQRQRLNNTASTSSTTIKFNEASVNKKKASTFVTNHGPRMNRTNPKYRAFLGLIGTWSTSCDSCNCLLIAFVCSRYCLQLPCVLVCMVTLCMCLFWPPGLKNPRVCKTLNRKPLRMCFPLHPVMSTWVA
jgi:hypothetical protein